MFFELNEEQHALQEMVTSLLAEQAPLSTLRTWPEDARTVDVTPSTTHAAWAALGEVGLLGLGVDESLGGSGGDTVDVAVVLEGAGHACLPAQLVAQLGVGVWALATSGADPALLAAVVAGTTSLPVSIDARRLAGGSGHGEGAPTAAVVVRDDTVLLVPMAAMELEPSPTWDIGLRQALIIGIDEAAATELDVDLEQLRARWLAAHATALVGTAQRILDLSVDHTSVREQFGSPIGSYQAVAHPLAQTHVEIEAARAGTWGAAVALRDRPDEALLAASVAAVAAVDAARQADDAGLQAHGGIAFTWEHDLHLALKHAVALRAAIGDATTLRATVAASLLAA